MSVLLSDLVARPELQLTVVTGQERLDRPVHAAHVSELVRPGPWLHGGELLMTIGLVLPMTERACREYVADVAAAGTSALALGLGAELPYQAAPAPLRRATAEAGLPLLTVGGQVPFLAVTKAVFAARAAEQRAAVEGAFETHRRLTAAAASGRGLAPTLHAWARATGVRTLVTDPLGRVLTAGGGGAGGPGGDSGDGVGVVDGEGEGDGDGVVAVDAPARDDGDGRNGVGRDGVGRDGVGRNHGGAGELPPGSVELVERVVAGGIRASARAPGLEVRPLGAGRLRGLLVLVGEVGAEARMLVSGLVSLLSLELERRHLAGEPERRHRAALLGRLLSPEVTAARARDVLAAAGLSASAVRAVAVGAATSDEGPATSGEGPAMSGTGPAASGGETAPPGELAAALALAVPGGLVRVRDGQVEAVVGEGLDIHRVLTRFAPGRPAGIGSPVPPHAAHTSLREASGLVEVSRGLGRPVEAGGGDSARLLLSLGERPALAGYADALLAPLETAAPSGDLVETLATWLDAGCSWDETSRRLGLHRHTVRNRLDKAMRLTGRRLDNADDRFDLWLAVRARRAAGDHTPGRG
ncbi:PucR family transcriptional regulator [Streptomyces sp. NRRL F-5053]|uniref:PucR family transcriptional regulator n=1 Tax=Streptomyces sp. NRRL F-5053 TaxID=1463854 RepID=UPI0004C900F6|nr:PucR family transcriptional regulator [Streptomyces sp. NRRL F-5053]